jgi:hypothetical protein
MHQKIPRLELNDLDPALREALMPRVERLGYLGEFFKCTGHQPRSLLAFMELTDALKAALPDNLTEVVALTIAGFAGNKYERYQHERLALKLGFTREWIADINRLAVSDSTELSEEENLVRRLALEVMESGGRGVGPLRDAVVEAIGYQQTIAILILIGRYAAHAMIVNALELAPPVESIFDEEES